MSLTLVTPPSAGSEPILLDEVKLQVLQGLDVDDSFLATIAIPAARDRAETITGRVFLTQTWDLYLDAWPCGGIDLPLPPLRSVTHVKYLNTSGVLTTLTVNTDYVVDAPAGPRCRRGRVTLPPGAVWPATYSQANAIVVRFIAGYGAAEDVPPMLKTAMLLDAGAFYVHRESVPVKMPGDDTYWSFRSHPMRAA